MERRKSAIIIAAVVVVAVAVGGVAAYSYASSIQRAPSEDELPNSLIIDNQKSIPEVKAFMEKYPDANVTVDRSGRLAVDYRVDKVLSDNADSVHTLRLRIFADNQATPQEMYIDCADNNNSHIKYDDILNYIKTENCL